MGKGFKSLKLPFVFAGVFPSLFLSDLNSQTSTNFPYSGSVRTWTVPGGVNSVDFAVEGAQGGYGGGWGGKTTGTLTVSNGQVLYLYVGGSGGVGTGHPGGWNGGGKVAGINGDEGTGGGASDIRIGGTNLSYRVVVAGGGGGRGGWNGTAGGPGGLTGANGVNGQAQGGRGGSQSIGGAGGAGYFGGSAGTVGSLGIGGQGGRGESAGGGGGGGGFYGGGGGGGDDDFDREDGGGGGGGSSYSDPVRVTGVQHLQGTRAGNGQITLTYLAPVGPSNLTPPVLFGSAQDRGNYHHGKRDLEFRCPPHVPAPVAKFRRHQRALDQRGRGGQRHGELHGFDK